VRGYRPERRQGRGKRRDSLHLSRFHGGGEGSPFMASPQAMLSVGSGPSRVRFWGDGRRRTRKLGGAARAPPSRSRRRGKRKNLFSEKELRRKPLHGLAVGNASTQPGIDFLRATE
jgi:hypothetical protein